MKSSAGSNNTVLFFPGHKHEPPDLLDIDPDLLTTLSSPLGSVESYDSTSDDAVMLENWQMNEVFQDIPVQDVRCLRCLRCLHVILFWTV